VGKAEGPNKSQSKLLRWLVFMPLATMTAYQGAHYATATVIHTPGFCCGHCTHAIAGKEVTSWADEYLFWPADCFDQMIGINPYRASAR